MGISVAARKARRTPIDNGDGTALIPLTHNRFALIDSVDIERVCFLTWFLKIEADGRLYAMTNFYHSDGSKRCMRMHRMLLCFPYYQIDHIDGDGLNNRRSNLRFCNNHQNQWNCGKHRPGKYSRCKGVSKHVSGLWTSQLMKNRVHVHAKYHKTELEAALAYDAAATFHFGEFAATNAKLGLLPND